MATIVKNKKAPEGDLTLAIGNLSFKLSDDKPYETDDLTVIEHARGFDFLDVEDEVDSKDLARAERDANKELQKERAKAEKANAEKDPTAPGIVPPETLEDVAKAKKTSEGDKN